MDVKIRQIPGDARIGFLQPCRVIGRLNHIPLGGVVGRLLEDRQLMQGEHVVRGVAEEYVGLLLLHGGVQRRQRQGFVHLKQLEGLVVAVGLGADLLDIGRGPARCADPDLALAVAV